MSKIFTNPNQLQEWIAAAEGIQKQYGVEKALAYLIGEKFYSLVGALHSARKIIRAIDEERKNPGFNPVRVSTYQDNRIITNLDETYGDEEARVREAEGLLIRFAFLISEAFSGADIRQYFDSNPRLGIHGHVTIEEHYEFLVTMGVIPHSVEHEVQDALILGDMMKYFGIDV